MNKVTHLVRWFLPFTASFIRNQIVYHQRYQPSLVYLQKKEGAFQREISTRFKTFYPLSDGLSKVLYEKGRYLTPGAKTKIKGFLSQQMPKILHVHYGVDCLIYSDIIKEMGIPTCVSFYGYDCTSFPKRFNGYGKTLLQKKVFQNPQVKAIFAMTEDMKADLLAIGCPEEKIIVHYYGTETQPFYQEISNGQKDKINVLIISGLHEKKGHDFLIESFTLAQKQVATPMHLHIVGGGTLHEKIEMIIKEKQLDNVTLHGSVQYGSETHLNFLKQAQIFAHPSITPPNGDKEGIPGAIIEAMAAGLPVISTYHAGIPHIMKNEDTGLLVKERDVQGLTTALVRLTQDHELRLKIAKAGQDEALHHLDVKEKEKELEEIYDSLI